MKMIRLAFVCSLLALAGRPAPGQAPKPDARAGEAAIRAVVEAFVQAFNKGDAPALAELFAPDAQIELEDGTIIAGRDAVAAQFAETFAQTPRPTIAIRSESITFLGNDVALEEGESILKRGDTDNTPEVGRYTVLYVKRDGKWLHARLRELPSAAAELSHHERLQELEWMIGEWVNESGDGVVETSCDWAEGGAFLDRTFTVKIAGRPAMTGTQRIGWDPVRGQFRSWLFDSQGGFAEGLWSRGGDKRWIIKASGVTSDGQIASGTQIITFVNKDVSTWTSIHRSIDGEAIDDADEFRLVRRPPRPGKAPAPRDEKRGTR